MTSVVVVALSLYTFWAVKRGSDFGFLGPFLFASLLVLLVFAVFQVHEEQFSFLPVPPFLLKFSHVVDYV